MLVTIPDWIPLVFLPLLLVAAIVGWVLLRFEKERAQQLAKEELRYRNLFENARDILLTLSPEGRILQVNRAIERIIGMPRDRAIDLELINVTADAQSRELVADHLRRVRDHRSSGTTQFRVRGRNPATGEEEIRILEIGSHALPESGTVSRIESTARDVTMRRHLEDGKLQAEQLEAVSRLSGGIAHDFNNILTIIRGNAEQISEGPDPTDRGEGVHAILGAARRAELLTLQLMGHSRRQFQKPEALEVHELVRDTMDNLALMLPEDIKIKLALTAEEPFVFASRSSIEQLLLNLSLNARDALPEGGTLTIETWRQELAEVTAIDDVSIAPGPYVVLAVSDNGVGMDEPTMARIFEPFFTSKHPGRGSGLGLATVQSSLTRMGGHILVDSSPGTGTRFTLYLPWSDARPAGTLHPKPKVQGSETVLLVEDDEQVRDVFATGLRGAGFQVWTANSAEDALQQSSTHFDALVTDVTSTGMLGSELAQRLRERNPDAPILFVSGLPPQHDTGSVPRSSFLKKPLAPGDLTFELRTLLDADPGP